MRTGLPRLLLVLGIVAAVHVSAFLLAARDPSLLAPVGEGHYYESAARRVLAGDPFAAGSIYLAPQYEYAVAALRGLFGDARLPLRILNLALLLGSIVVLAALARGGGGRRGALLGIALFALSGASLDEATALSPSHLSLFTALLFLFAGRRLRGGPPRPGAALLWGVTGALTALSGLGYLVLALGEALATLFWWARGGRPGFVRPAVAAAIGLALVLLPASLRSGRAGGDALPIPWKYGFDLFHGLRPGSDTIVPRRVPADSLRWEGYGDLVHRAERVAGRRLDSGEAARSSAREALGAAASKAFFPLAARVVSRTHLALSGWEAPDERSIAHSLGEISPMYSWARFLPALLIPLAAAGLFFHRPTREEVRWIVSLLVGLALAYVTGRDRLPLLALLAPFAGAGAVSLFAAAGPDGRRRGVPALLVLAAAAILLLPDWQRLRGPGENRSEDHRLRGNAHQSLGRNSAALSEYEKALQADSTNPYAHFGVGSTLAADGVYEEAVREFDAAVRWWPGYFAGHQARCVLEARLERNREALASADAMVRIAPFDPEALNTLGMMSARVGLYDQAVQSFRAALREDSTHAGARANLAELARVGIGGVDTTGGRPGALLAGRKVEEAMDRIRERNFAAAESALAAAERSDPAYPTLDQAWGNLRLSQGKFPEAIERYERALRVRRANILVLNNLAAAHAQNGDLARAIPIWEEVLRRSPENELARRNLEAARREQAARGAGVK